MAPPSETWDRRAFGHGSIHANRAFRVWRVTQAVAVVRAPLAGPLWRQPEAVRATVAKDRAPSAVPRRPPEPIRRRRTEGNASRKRYQEDRGRSLQNWWRLCGLQGAAQTSRVQVQAPSAEPLWLPGCTRRSRTDGQTSKKWHQEGCWQSLQYLRRRCWSQEAVRAIRAKDRTQPVVLLRPPEPIRRRRTEGYASRKRHQEGRGRSPQNSLRLR